MKPEHLAPLEREKNFRINHLNNYQEEKLGQEIGDNAEGTSNLRFEIGDYTFNNGNRVNNNFETAFHNMQSGISIDNTSKVTLQNVAIEQSIVDRNYFVLCTCLEYDEKVKREFGGAT
ncbi:hypothetical protein [Halobacillus mangrovi]|uniref:hypothetical protein n=1 Tax=Halobacillus mangrovi TaxID=402384 RepID=UPI003D97DFEF